jgi:GT2 family glycosyltransferase
MTDISIVIVSWNAKKYLEECLTSLARSEGGLSIEIIVADNASSDGSDEMVRSQFPYVKLIQTGANLGFSKGNNVAIPLATGKYVCLINSDVNVPPGCLQKMFRYMEENATVGLIGPRMQLPDGLVHRSGMRFPSTWNIFLRAVALDSLFKGSGFFGGYLMSDFQFDQTRDIDVLNGWFWMARREAASQVGLLDEQFFMYGEDIDWCKRFHLAGWRVVFFAGAEALHYGGASSSNAPLRFFVEMQRANLQYWKKYHGRTSLFFYLFYGFLNYSIRLIAWGLLYIVHPARRSKAQSEIKQNITGLRWLLSQIAGKGPDLK